MTAFSKDEPMNQKDAIIGIDFGTSKSVISVWKDGAPQVIPDLQGHAITPSVVMLGPDGQLFVGWDAINHPDRYKGKHFTINSVKRQMGKSGETSWGQYKTFPQEISALLFGQLKIQAEGFLGQPVNRAVVAIPANFNINQRWAILQAAEIAGFKVMRLINEATAAMLAARQVGITRDGTALIFDFGAGTLDVSILSYGKGVFEVLATAGDDRLGGDDCNQLIVDHIIQQARQTIGKSIELSDMDRMILRETAAKAKIELSSASSTRIYIAGFFRGIDRYHDLEMTLQRDQFDGLCQPLYLQVKAVLERAISDAGCLNPRFHDTLTDAFLVGGSSKIPGIREIVHTVTGLAPSTFIDGELGVSQGAAVQAGVFSHEVHDVLLLDVTPCTYSVMTQGGTATPIIERNTTIPCMKRSTFKTTTDNQTEISLRVLQGEKPMAADNDLVGVLRLIGITPAPANVSQIEVSFDIDQANLLTVTAADKASGRMVQATMESAYRLNPAQMNVLQRKVNAELHNMRLRVTEGNEQRRRDEAIADARSFSKALQDFLEIGRGSISADSLDLLTAGNKLIANYIDWNVPAEKLQDLIGSIRSTCDDAYLPLFRTQVLAIGQSSDIHQWAENCTTTWGSIEAFRRALDQLAAAHDQVSRGVSNYLAQAKKNQETACFQKLFTQVKESLPSSLFLAILLISASNTPAVPFRFIPSNAAERRLLTILLLAVLLRGAALERRTAAAELASLTSDQGKLFLSEYRNIQSDPEAKAWLDKCMASEPAGSFLAYYRGLAEAEQKSFIANLSLKKKVLQDLIDSGRSANRYVNLIALNDIQALGVSECSQEVAALLSRDNTEETNLKIIELLEPVTDKTIIVTLLGVLGVSGELDRRIFDFLESSLPSMDREIARVFKLAKSVLSDHQPLSLLDRPFLSKTSKKYPALKPAIDHLVTGK
jgi:molecular chaperone DnaK